MSWCLRCGSRSADRDWDPKSASVEHDGLATTRVLNLRLFPSGTLSGRACASVLVVGQDDHEDGVTALWRHAHQFGRSPLDQLNAVGLSLIAKQRYEAGWDLDPHEIGQRKPLGNEWLLPVFQFRFIGHVDSFRLGYHLAGFHYSCRGTIKHPSLLPTVTFISLISSSRASPRSQKARRVAANSTRSGFRRAHSHTVATRHPFSRSVVRTARSLHRTSYPHAESTEDEFAYVIDRTSDVWIGGVLHRLRPGGMRWAFRPAQGFAIRF